MTTTSRLDRAIATHRQQNNVDIVLGYLKSPDGSGDPRLRDGSGRLWVSVQTAEGYSRPVALPVDTNANIPPNDNLSVEVGYIHGEQCVLRASRRGMLGAGTNPAVTNPADPDVRAGNQTVGESQFRCKRSADSSKPWTVVVETGYIENEGFAYIFIESEIDLSGLVPSADEKVIACVYVRTDLTLEAFASSVVLPDDPITSEMINECRQQADPTSMSVWGWVLEGDLSGLTENPAKNIDLRKPAAPPVSSTTSTTLPNFGAGVVKTLVSGIVAAGDDRHLIIAAESGTTDTLTEITGLNVGDEVIIRADTGDTITIAHNDAGATDKILLHNGADIDLSGDQTLKLMKIEEGKVVQYVDEKGSGTGGGSGVEILLDYEAVTDLANDLIISADTWTVIGTDQSFTVTDASAIVTISIRGVIVMGTNFARVGARLRIDDAGTPQNFKLGGGVVPAGYYQNALAGSGAIQITGLSAGSHTARIEVYSEAQPQLAYCRASSSITETLGILVMQLPT